METLTAVINVGSLDPQPPWPVSQVPPDSILRLWRNTTPDETGLVVQQLAAYNRLEIGQQAAAVLRRIIAAESLVLPGGLQVLSEDGRAITPGCCCGLEDWRDWETLLADGCSPWLGHAPEPWVQKLDAAFRVWAHRVSDLYIDIQRADLADQLRAVQNDLAGFLANLEQWSNEVDAELAHPFVEKFDRHFSIRRKYAPA